MPSTTEYLKFILEQLSDLTEITYKAMMGEFFIYYRGKPVGGIYDNLIAHKTREVCDFLYAPSRVYFAV